GGRVLAQCGFHLLGLHALGLVLAGCTAVLGVGRVDADNLGDIVRSEPERRKRQRRHAGNSSQSRHCPAREYGVQDRAVRTDLDTLLTALYVKIDDEIGGTRWLGRPGLRAVPPGRDVPVRTEAAWLEQAAEGRVAAGQASDRSAGQSCCDRR